jgi:hypothetical protein
MRCATIVILLTLWPSIGAAAPDAILDGDDTGAPARRNAAGETSDGGPLEGARVPVVAPPVAGVLTAAYAAAGLDRNPARSFRRRARLAGLAPWITLRTARDTSWQDAGSAVGHGTSFEARATWRLDRLVFDDHEPQAAAAELARLRERRRLAARVIRAYFAWRRAAGAGASSDDDRVIVRIAEVTAELDALTDDWFSAELTRLRRRRFADERSRDPTTP